MSEGGDEGGRELGNKGERQLFDGSTQQPTELVLAVGEEFEKRCCGGL